MLSKENFYERLNNESPGADGGDEIEIYFEPLTIEHLDEIHRYSQDVRLYEFFEFDVFNSIEHTKSYIQKLEQRMGGDFYSKSAKYWVVRRAIDGYLIGTASLANLNYQRKSVEWGYGIDPDLWGSGYILQIQEVLKKYVFQGLFLNRLYGVTMATNARTISSLLATGMKNEGILRQYYCKDGKYIDGWQYSMILDEYLKFSINSDTAKVHLALDDVVKVVASILDSEEIHEESNMCNTVSWDSFSHMSIMVKISEELGISLSPSEMMRATSIRALATIINERF